MLVLALNEALKATTDGGFMKYGTAGFRGEASLLTHIIPRCTLVAILVSIAHGYEYSGLMITASHNPARDNGIKITDVDGSMISADFESIATLICNAENPGEAFKSELIKLTKETNEEVLQDIISQKAKLIIGCDTRDTSAGFLNACLRVAKDTLKMKNFISIGFVTTPVVHFFVWGNLKLKNLIPNTAGPSQKKVVDQSTSSLTSSVDETFLIQKYVEHFSVKLKNFYDIAGISVCESMNKNIFVDCACGVGSMTLQQFNKDKVLDPLQKSLHIRNSPQDGILNLNCGSDYVMNTRGFPQNFSDLTNGELCCSFDGDGDRIIFFYKSQNDKIIQLLDGDKIACIILKCIIQIISKNIDKKSSSSSIEKKKISIGIVQTGYANAASTCYLETKILGHEQMEEYGVELKTIYTKTGVKNLHHEALNYDIGIYFEANGHGSAIFKEDKIKEWGIRNKCDVSLLLAYLSIFNAATGDAITDLFAIIAALDYLNINIADMNNFYTNNPCKLVSLKASRQQLDTLKPRPRDEMRLDEPAEIQNLIDDAVGSNNDVRAFIRPSGTENIARLYVEASNVNSVNETIQKIETNWIQIMKN